MDPERWQRIELLYQKARDLGDAERTDFLIQACAGDEDLQREVESLLAADEEAPEFLATPYLGPGLEVSGPEVESGGLRAGLDSGADGSDPDPAGTTGADGPVLLGSRVGPYRLEEVIASGGMGTVYLGTRDDHEFHKRVAVKLIRRGLDTEAILQRFHVERQVMANLDHPHIARLLDGGTTEDGLPYLVMELIEGQSIDRFCDSRRLPVKKRLKLFLDVCDAVQYAHRNLIVHRDIKTSNILVTADGSPKLLDFGIAKILGPESLASTATAQRFLTPESASPEQVRGQPITIATDIYSLGIVLYKLVTGRPPYVLETRDLSEIGRIICEQKPTRPSLASQSAAGSQYVGLRPERLRRELAGDIDNIALMALRKEPEQRYASVKQFADDIHAYLAGRPVEARRPTIRYRLGKFVTRNKAASVAAGLLVVSLLAGGAAVLHESSRARREAQLTSRVLASVDRLFQSFDPAVVGGTEAPLREILDRGAAEVFLGLEDNPEGQAMLASRIADLYGNLGVRGQSASWRERAIELYEALPGRGDLDLADSLHKLGAILRSDDPRRAEEILTRALTIRRRRLGERSPDVAATLNILAFAVMRQGDRGRAEVLFRDALEIRRNVFIEPHPHLVASLQAYAALLADRGDYGEAEGLLREAMDLADQLLDPGLKTGVGANLAGLLQDTGRYTEAEPLVRASLEASRVKIGDRHPATARRKINLSLLLKDMGRFDEAEILCREGLNLLVEHYEEDNEEVGEAWLAMAKVLSDKGDLVGAEEASRKALSTWSSLWGDDHLLTARPMTLLARTLVESGKYTDAEPLAREALRIQQEGLPEKSWKTAKAASVLGAALAGLGRYEEAEPLLVESYPIIRDDRGEKHLRTRQAIERIVFLYESWGRLQEARHYQTMLKELAGS